MTRHMDDIIGTDVSKDTLDVHRLADGSNRQFPNGTAGHSKLLKWLEALPSLPLVIYEATGAYHRQLERRLGAKALSFVKVNPKQARRFAQASGKSAKTDSADSEMLARMGVALQLTPKTQQAENLYDLRELLAARRALVKDRTAAMTRRATSTIELIEAQLDKRLRHIAGDIGKIDGQMMDVAHKDQNMAKRMEQLISIPPSRACLHALPGSGDRHKYGAHDLSRHARDWQLDQQTSRQPRGPCSDVTKLGKMAGQSADFGRTSQPAQRDIYARTCRNQVQFGYEAEIRSPDCCGERKEGRDHSRNAQAACVGKCSAARR